MLTVGSLFSGIGGLELGLERAGMQVKWQVENDPYCIKVLEKHWPDVRRWDDITTFLANAEQQPAERVAGQAGGQGRQCADPLEPATVRQAHGEAGTEGTQPRCGNGPAEVLADTSNARPSRPGCQHEPSIEKRHAVNAGAEGRTTQ